MYMVHNIVGQIKKIKKTNRIQLRLRKGYERKQNCEQSCNRTSMSSKI